MAVTVVPWWAGLAPAEAGIPCGGATHTVRWEAGDLRLPDHRDVDAEQVLAALGGSPPACVRLLDMWRRHVRTVELVTVGRRPGEPDLGLRHERRDEPRDEPRALIVRRIGPQRVPPLGQSLGRGIELTALMSLPGPMIDRLVLTVMAECAARWDDDDFREEHGLRIGAAVAGRALPALRRLGARVVSGAVDVGVSPARPGHGPTIAARLEPGQPSVVSAELPIAWLPEVWGRGVSEPDGEFVLRVTGGSADGTELHVDVAEWTQSGAIAWEVTAVPARLVTDEDGRRRVIRD